MNAPKPNPAWRRLRRAFRPRLSRSHVAGGVLLGLLGFAATAQVRAISVDDEYVTASRTQLIQILDGLDQRSARLESEIADLEQDRADLQSGAGRTREAIEQAERRAETLGILAGTLPATGPGITLIISDAKATVTASLILNAIEELRDAGAEAIELNDRVRVVASSYVLDGQGGIIVDDTLLPPPYTIEAIGDPRGLGSAMQIPGGVTEEVSQQQGVATVTEQDLVEIDSLHRPAPSRYARSAAEEAEDAATGDDG